VSVGGGGAGGSAPGKFKLKLKKASEGVDLKQLKVEEAEVAISGKNMALGSAKGGNMALGSAKGGDMDVSLVSDESRAGSSYEGPKFECEFAHASRAAHEARAGCPFFEACTRFHILKVAPGLDVVAPIIVLDGLDVVGLDVVAPIIVLDAQIHADSLGRGQTPRMVAKELQASL